MEPPHRVTFPDDPAMEEEFGFYRNFLTSLVQEEEDDDNRVARQPNNYTETLFPNDDHVFTDDEDDHYQQQQRDIHHQPTKQGIIAQRRPAPPPPPKKSDSFGVSEAFYSNFISTLVDHHDGQDNKVPRTVTIDHHNGAGNSVDDSDLEPAQSVAGESSATSSEPEPKNTRRSSLRRQQTQPDPPEKKVYPGVLSTHQKEEEAKPRMATAVATDAPPRSSNTRTKSSLLMPRLFQRRANGNAAARNAQLSETPGKRMEPAVDIEQGRGVSITTRSSVKSNNNNKLQVNASEQEEEEDGHTVATTPAMSIQSKSPVSSPSRRKHTPLPRPYDKLNYLPKERSTNANSANDAEPSSSASAAASEDTTTTLANTTKHRSCIAWCCCSLLRFFCQPARFTSTVMLLLHAASAVIGMYAFLDFFMCCDLPVELEQFRIYRIVSLTYFCWVFLQFYPVVHRNYLRYWTLLNPYFGFLLVAALALQSRRWLAVAVFSTEVVGLCLQWILVGLQWNDITWRWIRLILSLLPLVLVIFKILLAYLDATGQCVVFDDDEGSWFRANAEACVICSGDEFPRALDMYRDGCIRQSTTYSSDIWGQEGDYCGSLTNKFCFIPY